MSCCEHLGVNHRLVQIKAFPDKLFLIIDNTFNGDDFYIFEAPAKYKITNAIFTTHYLSGQDQKILHRFEVKNYSDFIDSNNLLLWGTQFDGLLDYFHRKTGKNVMYSEYLPDYKYGKVSTIKTAP